MAIILPETNAMLALDGNLIKGKLSITDSVLEFRFADGRIKELYSYDIVFSNMLKEQIRVKTLFETKILECVYISSENKKSGMYIVNDKDADEIISSYSIFRVNATDKRRVLEEAKRQEELRLKREVEEAKKQEELKYKIKNPTGDKVVDGSVKLEWLNFILRKAGMNEISLEEVLEAPDISERMSELTAEKVSIMPREYVTELLAFSTLESNNDEINSEDIDLDNIDYADAESFEEGLNAGENLVGKTVSFVVKAVKPDSFLGFDLWAGEHLNFVSNEAFNVNEGDICVVRADSIEKIEFLTCSWKIKYSKKINLSSEDSIQNKDEMSEKTSDLGDLEFDLWLEDETSENSGLDYTSSNEVISFEENKKRSFRPINKLKYKTLSDYVYESSDDYVARRDSWNEPYEYVSYYGESRLDYAQDQKLENALYVLGYYPWSKVSKEICESLYLISESCESFIYDSIERFAYDFLDYKYKITNKERIQTQCVTEINVFRENFNELFLAIEVDISGDENYVRNELREIATVFHQISNRASHFLFCVDSSIMFASFALVEQKNVSFDKLKIERRKKLNVPTNYVTRCITSEFFDYYMPEEGWTKIKEIDPSNYVQTFARSLEIERLSAEYIIYELAPFKDSHKLDVEQLTAYCREVVTSLYGSEWFEINENNYVSEIREERLSDEDWDLLEFELESNEQLYKEMDEKFDDEFDEENDAIDDIPYDVLNDPIAMLKWLEENGKEGEVDNDELDYSVVGMLSELIIAAGGELPIDVQKINWSKDYHFIVKELKNGYAYGDAYLGDIWQKRTSYPLFNSWHKYKFYKEYLKGIR
ncbi:hypothetical protein [Lacrimispora saccharolytica]|uniref:hypothetical protein n=1 Tax=Lacrimispora saccharolytica TaxID=84030 RepID=UPI00265D27C2|nr:hypothetical protein [Lacrimispora saccharolytica]MCF2657508.1 hypothetical protein [Lacrimispora saccharolytica]